ncbi:MAG: hypothetical protein WBA46_02695 [Thermomicrobiales bacterium]
MHNRRLSPRLATVVVIAALGISTLAPVASPALAGTPAKEASVARLDLPAALPVSADLADAGFSGYRWASMDAETGDDFFVDTGDDPAYTTSWQQTGYVAGFAKTWQAEASLGTPATESDATFVIGSVHQFETASGASDAFALIEGDGEGDLPADYQDYAIDLGDEASHVSFSFDGNGDGLVHTVMVREQNLIAEVDVFYGADFSTDARDQEESAAQLATLVDDGLQTVLAGETPNLGQLAPVYEDGGLLDFNDYLYRDGAVTELYPGESAADGAARAQTYTDANAVALYRVIQPIVGSGKDAPHYGASTTFTRFASARDAKTWLAGRPDALQASSGVIDVAPATIDADLLPDGIAAKDVSAFTYTLDFVDNEPYYKIQVNVRVGDLGFTTYLESAVATPSTEALMAVVDDIVAGIEAGGCPPVLQVPAATQADADALANKAR